MKREAAVATVAASLAFAAGRSTAPMQYHAPEPAHVLSVMVQPEGITWVAHGSVEVNGARKLPPIHMRVSAPLLVADSATVETMTAQMLTECGDAFSREHVIGWNIDAAGARFIAVIPPGDKACDRAWQADVSDLRTSVTAAVAKQAAGEMVP